MIADHSGGCLPSQISSELLTPELLALLQACVEGPHPDPRVAALNALACLAFCRDNKQRIRQQPGLLHTLVRLASTPSATSRLHSGSPHGPGGVRIHADRVAAAAGVGESMPQLPVVAGLAAGGTGASGSPAAASPARRPPGVAGSSGSGNNTSSGSPATAAPVAAAATQPSGAAAKPAAAGWGAAAATAASSGAGPTRMVLPMTRGAGHGAERHSDTGSSGGFAFGVGSPPSGAAGGPSGGYFPSHSFSGAAAPGLGAMGMAAQGKGGPSPVAAPMAAAAASRGGGVAAAGELASPPGRPLHHSASTPSAVTLVAAAAGAAAGSGGTPQATARAGGSTSGTPAAVAAATGSAAPRTLSPGRASLTSSGGPLGWPGSASGGGAGMTEAAGARTGVMSPLSPTADGPVVGGGGGGGLSLPPVLALALPRAVPEAVACRDQERLLAIKTLAILGGSRASPH